MDPKTRARALDKASRLLNNRRGGRLDKWMIGHIGRSTMEGW